MENLNDRHKSGHCGQDEGYGIQTREMVSTLVIECVQVGVRKDAGNCSAAVTGLVTGDRDSCAAIFLIFL